MDVVGELYVSKGPELQGEMEASKECADMEEPPEGDLGNAIVKDHTYMGEEEEKETDKDQGFFWREGGWEKEGHKIYRHERKGMNECRIHILVH